MRRRDFIACLGSTVAAWPIAVGAQQQALPVVGFLHSQSPDLYAPMATAFRGGLRETGYLENQNVAIEYRWAENESARLPAMGVDLVRRAVTVIFAAGGSNSAL